MTNYRVRLFSIQKRLPAGFRLPASFLAFAREMAAARRGDHGWFAVEHTNPDKIVGARVRDDVMPFLTLPDGGAVAFWIAEGREPAVVWLSGEDEPRLVGASWEDFLARFRRGRTGVLDLDDREVAPPRSRGAARLPSLAAQRKAWKRWIEPRLPEDDQLRFEPVRGDILRVVRKHFHGPHDILTLVATVTDREYHVQWYAGGLAPFPQARALKGPLTRLRELLGRPLRRYQLVVWADGRIFV